jgi:hypothetical protein
MSESISPASDMYSGLGRRRDPEERDGERIAGRLVKAIGRGANEYTVRGGRLGIFETTHNAGTYAVVAALAHQDGLEIEAHRFIDEYPAIIGENPIQTTTVRQEYDKILVTSMDGIAVERPAGFHDDHIAQVYPPPQDLDGMHNLSLRQPS